MSYAQRVNPNAGQNTAPNAGQNTAPNTTPSRGTKRKNDSSQDLPNTRPRGTNFTDGSKLIPRPPRRTTAQIGNTEDSMDSTVGEEKSAAAAEAKKKKEEEDKIFEAFLLGPARPRTSKAEGQIRFFKGNLPRFAPTNDWFRIMGKDKPFTLAFIEFVKNGGDALWVQAYNQPNPDETVQLRLKAAISHIADIGLAPGLDPKLFEVILMRKPGAKSTSAPILVRTENKTQAKLLLDLGHFVFKDSRGENAFFTQAKHSYRSAVMIDIKNAPQDTTHFVNSTMGSLHHVIKWQSRDDDKSWIPQHFSYSKIDPPKAIKNITPNTAWRVAFVPDEEAWSVWTMPATMGVYGAKGEVGMEDPSFCNHCISLSHASEQCLWWKVPGITSDTKKPKDVVEVKWLTKKSYTPSESEVKAVKEAATSRPDKPSERELLTPGPSGTQASQGEASIQ